MERTIPPTVSPVENNAAFSSHVPKSSLWERHILSSSQLFTTAYMSWPLKNLSLGWVMRETDMASIGISEGRPQPMSTKHPKGSRCVTFAGITSPDVSVLIYRSMHSSCARRLDNLHMTSPFSWTISVTLKHTVLFTLESNAMSFVLPSCIPIAPSDLGIIPLPKGSSTIMLCSLSQSTAWPSSINPWAIASAIVRSLWR